MDVNITDIHVLTEEDLAWISAFDVH